MSYTQLEQRKQKRDKTKMAVPALSNAEVKESQHSAGAMLALRAHRQCQQVNVFPTIDAAATHLWLILALSSGGACVCL